MSSPRRAPPGLLLFFLGLAIFSVVLTGSPRGKASAEEQATPAEKKKKETKNASESQAKGSGGRPTSGWLPAHATFYGDETASQTMGGACGFGNLFDAGYGSNTAALSTSLFRNGFLCGSCYEIKCTESPHCLAGNPSVTITATNICPPNFAQDPNDGGWCNPPRDHFDMAKPAFMKIADWHAGIVPITYKRVPCEKKGGVRFMFQGNDYWLLVYVMNVGADGDVSSLAVKGSKTGWIPMSHNWGTSYQAFESLGGQPLSFKVTSYSTNKTLVCNDVTPDDWNMGLTYEADVNFQ